MLCCHNWTTPLPDNSTWGMTMSNSSYASFGLCPQTRIPQLCSCRAERHGTQVELAEMQQGLSSTQLTTDGWSGNISLSAEGSHPPKGMATAGQLPRRQHWHISYWIQSLHSSHTTHLKSHKSSDTTVLSCHAWGLAGPAGQILPHRDPHRQGGNKNQDWWDGNENQDCGSVLIWWGEV